MQLYNQYSTYIKRKFSERVQKITVHSNFSCPNRDGTIGWLGCSYCNNDSFSAPKHIAQLSILDQIEHGIATSKRRYKKSNKFIIYFQSYTSTHASIDKMKEIFEQAISHPSVIGLSIGTRPDCINEEKIIYLAQLSKKFDITIEYGLETTNDKTLLQINRGHDLQAFIKAVELTKKLAPQIHICTHIIIGLPGESTQDTLNKAKIINQLKIDSVKVHQLQVLKNTPLEKEFLQNNFQTLTVEEYFFQIQIFLENLNQNILIQRLFGSSPENLVIAPSWGDDYDKLLNELRNYLSKNQSFQGKARQCHRD